MPIRTTPEAVEAIIEVDPNIDLTPFIEVGSLVVDKWCAPVEDENGDPFYTAGDLEIIERWLSAHFYAVRKPRRTSASVAGGASESLQSSTAVGFASSHYGQMAMRLDRSGQLAVLEAQTKDPEDFGIVPIGNPVAAPSAFVSWLGKDRRSG